MSTDNKELTAMQTMLENNKDDTPFGQLSPFNQGYQRTVQHFKEKAVELLTKEQEPILPTAEEYCRKHQNSNHPDMIADLMIEFAKLHVVAALKAAHRNTQLPEEDLDFTLNSYPLTNII